MNPEFLAIAFDLFLKIAPIVISVFAFVLSLITFLYDLKLKIAKVKLKATFEGYLGLSFFHIKVINQSWNSISILESRVCVNGISYTPPRNYVFKNLPMNLPSYYSDTFTFPLEWFIENKPGDYQLVVIDLYTSRGIFRFSGNFHSVEEMNFKMKRLKEKSRGKKMKQTADKKK